MMRTGTCLAVGLASGWIVDQLVGDPSRGHPVAGFGQLAGAAEQLWYKDSRRRGIFHEAVLVGGAVALGGLAQWCTRRNPVATIAATGIATWAVLGGRSLAREAEAISGLLAADDLAGSRLRVRNLVGRDPETLDADGVARAAVESVAENTSDAVVAPLFWGAVAGIPGLLGYRAINTLDAMVGHRNARYGRFGWAAAKLDDLVNWIPARLSAALALAAAPIVGGDIRAGVRAVRHQSSQHPSPNGGVVEGAFAGVLGIRLGGRNVYGGVEEDRGVLGYGPTPQPKDLGRANTLAFAVSAGAAAVATVVAWRRQR